MELSVRTTYKLKNAFLITEKWLTSLTHKVRTHSSNHRNIEKEIGIRSENMVLLNKLRDISQGKQVSKRSQLIICIECLRLKSPKKYF